MIPINTIYLAQPRQRRFNCCRGGEGGGEGAFLRIHQGGRCVGQQSTEDRDLLPPVDLESAGRVFSVGSTGCGPGLLPVPMEQEASHPREQRCWLGAVAMLCQGAPALVAGTYLLPALSVLGRSSPGTFPGSGSVQREGAGLHCSIFTLSLSLVGVRGVLLRNNSVSCVGTGC